MSATPLDYAAIAKQYGAVSSSHPGADYGAIAKQFGAIDSQPAQQQQPTEQPGFFTRLGQSLGIPTSQKEAQATFQSLAPKSVTDLVNMATPGGVAGNLIKNYGNQVAGNFQGYKQNLRDLGSDIATGRTSPVSAARQFGNYTAEQAVRDIPVAGESLWNYGGDINQGNYAGAGGGATGLLTQAALAKTPTKIPPDSVLGRMLLLGKTPEGAIESAMKPGTTIPIAKRAALAQTSLQEGIPVSQKGLSKLGDLIDNVNQEIAQKIAADPNRPISTAQSMRNIADLKANGPFGNQVNPRADLNAIDASGQEFQDIYGNQMPAAQAQAVKQGTYKAIGKKYGELGSASTEAQKALARGLKEELANQFQELNDLNARDGRLLDLQTSLQRAVNRIGNHQLIGIGTPIAGAAASAITGSPNIGKVAMVMKAVLDNPVVKSKLAIALSHGKIPSPMVMPKIAAYAGALGRLSQPSSLPFLPGSQQPPAQSPDQ